MIVCIWFCRSGIAVHVLKPTMFYAHVNFADKIEVSYCVSIIEKHDTLVHVVHKIEVQLKQQNKKQHTQTNSEKDKYVYIHYASRMMAANLVKNNDLVNGKKKWLCTTNKQKTKDYTSTELFIWKTHVKHNSWQRNNAKKPNAKTLSKLLIKLRCWS